MDIWILVKLLVMLGCAALFWWGGFSFLSARRDIMPPILASACALFAQTFWAFTMLPVVAIYHLGYGEKSLFRHIFGDGWGRGVWGLLAGLCLSVGLLVTGHLDWYWFIPYLGLNFTLENALKNIPQKIGDPLIGCGFACIIFFVH